MGGDALGYGQSVGSIYDSAMAGDGVEGCGVLDGMAFHVPCDSGASGRLDCFVFAPQCRPRLHFGVPLPIPGSNSASITILCAEKIASKEKISCAGEVECS